MTPEALRRLIESGETLLVEFKGEERAALSDRELVETVVCLANRAGSENAWLLVGVEDDGRITGARPRHEGGHTDSRRLVALISHRTRPSLAVRPYLVPTAATYRRLGQPAEYVRQRAFEPLQQKQMVLQYVERHGRITRREVAGLCRISGPQAYRLLDRLAKQGLLMREGVRGRGVGYRKATE